MSYENGSNSKHSSPSSPYHDGSTASPKLAANPLVSATRIDASDPAPGTIRRTIRGIPKRKPFVNEAVNGSSLSSFSARTAVWNQSQPKRVNDVVTRRVTSSSESQTPQTSRSEAIEPLGSQLASESLKPLPLAQYFQQLRVSTHAQHRDTHTPTSPQPMGLDAASATVQRTSKSDSPFRFPSLPANLTDDGFHYRQRAAQFILLLSQWASREYMSRWNTLFLPVASNMSKSRDSSKCAAAGHGGYQHAVENPHSSVLDDNESTHSHDRAHSTSDNESEYLDFDACSTAHLGNKKKRKSSPYSNQALHSMSNNQQTLQGDAGSFPPNTSSPARSQDSAAGSLRDKQGRALVDKTNALHRSGSHLSVHPVYKREDVPSSWSEPSVVCRHPYLRLPPRQTSGERHRKIMRSRLRARLVPIFERRKLEKMQVPTQFKQDPQASQEAEDTRAKDEADTQAVTTPEKRAPPKRTSKAGKRAQAIRGGGSSAKPLTIAEIRARAAAASAGPSSGSATPAKTSPSLSSGPSLKEPNRTSNQVAIVEDQAKKHTLPSAPAAATTASPATASPSTASAGAVASHTRLPAPTSKFDFRMSSHITLKLREMRSQLDGATRNLTDPLNQGGPLAVAKVLCDFHTMQSSPTNVGDGATSAVTNRSSGHPDYLPPWVRDALEYPIWANGEQGVDAKSPQPRQARAPTSPAPPSQIHSRTLTPKQQGKQASPRAGAKPSPAPVSPSTSEATTGRQTSSRQLTEPAHKHGAACKHGQPHGRSRPPGTGSALFTDDDWICVFCEYELYYGETPLMLRACRNRKKLVEKKTKVKSRAQAALSRRSGSKVSGSSCQCDRDHYHHDHGVEHACMHDHDHACHHDHSSVSGSECCHHDDDHYHHKDGYHDHHHGHKSDQGRHRAHDDRDRCDCGNSIHSSDFEDEVK